MSSSDKRKRSVSESSDESTGLPAKKLSTSASTLKMEDLDKQSVFFASEYVPVKSLLDLMKKRRGFIDVPKIVNILIEFTKTHLDFSIDDAAWQICDLSVRPEQMKGIEILVDVKKKVRVFANKLRIEDAKLLDEEPLNRELFERWYCKVVDFLDQSLQLLNFLMNEASEKNENGKTSLLHSRERSFTYLFMKLTEICFLCAEPGKRSKTDLWIGNQRVGCVPDICYWQQCPMPERNILIMLAEVKNTAFRNSDDSTDDCCECEDTTNKISTTQSTCKHSETKSRVDKTPWIYNKVLPDVLAQFGCEMIAECPYSMFVPEILGILCMKTKIILNYLQLSKTHFNVFISPKEDVGKIRSHIQYTQIFNIMKADDRNQLLDLLFWLGCIQKRGLQRHYLVS